MAPFSMNLGQNDTEFEAGAERSLCHTGREEDRMPQLLRDENGLALVEGDLVLRTRRVNFRIWLM